MGGQERLATQLSTSPSPTDAMTVMESLCKGLADENHIHRAGYISRDTRAR